AGARPSRLSEQRSPFMIEAAMIWNEPNNKSHWDPEIDPDWSRFGQMARLAAEAIAEANPAVTRVLGGISPIDPGFMTRMRDYGVLDRVNAVAVHGFPLDWNLWQIHEWPQRLQERSEEHTSELQSRENLVCRLLLEKKK